ncbi:MAG TPA: SCO family protein [Alphaproteobacteria bacterium]|nr:SCO family protein [Alphaproteobacteria bacterium]
MANFMKFVVLALIGFGLGAGLAWFQKRETMKEAPPPITAAMTDDEFAGLDAARENFRPDIVPDAPAMPTAEGVTEEAADMAADATEDATEGVAETVEKTEQKVAGSTVGGAFTLTDHNGNAVTEKSWPGKKKLVFFGFTYCPDVCPAGLEKITTVLNALGDSVAEVQPLFISTDPKRDTPERLKEYLADYHASLVGLTGTEEQIEQAKSAYKVYAAKAEGGDAENYLINHSAYVYLMSEDDALLEIFGSSDTPETMVPKIRPHLGAAE